MNKTVRLFDNNAYMKSFEANVVLCEECDNGLYSVVLDKTCFFPEGGGQPSDKGILYCSDGKFVSVTDVQESDGIIYHYTDKPVSSDKIRGEIDFALRYERMRNHSGEHILSGLAHDIYGCTNVGFHLNDETVTVDFDKQLTQIEIDTLESRVNEIIAENVQILAYYPDSETLSKLEYRSKLELTENIRIVEIGNPDKLYDRCACCAPHVSQTSEIGMLLITGYMNYKSGTRLTMVCGKNAYLTARNTYSNAKNISAMLSSKVSEIDIAVEKYIQQALNEKAKNSELCNTYIDMKLSQIIETDGNIVLFESQLDRNQLRRLVDKAADKCGGMCAGFSGNDENGWAYIIISRNIDLKSISNELNMKMNGKGGGSSKMLQGNAFSSREKLEKIFEI